MDTSNIDSLLDSTLDDLEDLPEFAPFPPGAHRVKVSLDLKEVNKKTAVELKAVMINTEEYVDETTSKQTKEGDTASILFMLDNEYGQGSFKKIVTPIRDAIAPGKTNREVIEACKDVECLIITGLRKDKTDPDKTYLQIKELAVV